MPAGNAANALLAEDRESRPKQSFGANGLTSISSLSHRTTAREALVA